MSGSPSCKGSAQRRSVKSNRLMSGRQSARTSSALSSKSSRKAATSLQSCWLRWHVTRIRRSSAQNCWHSRPDRLIPPTPCSPDCRGFWLRVLSSILSSLIERPAVGGIEVDLDRLGKPRHHHVEADSEDDLHDLAVAEVRMRGIEHVIVDPHALD